MPRAEKPWPHLALHERYTTIPKAWKSQSRWYAWESRLEEGEYKIKRMARGKRELTTYFQAYSLATSARGFGGVGFDFLPHADPTYLCLQLQNCRDPKSQETDPWVADLLKRFAPAYVEIDRDGTGFVVIAACQQSLDECRTVGVPRVHLRPHLMQLLDPSIQIETCRGPIPFSGFCLPKSGSAEDCTTAFDHVIKQFISPPPEDEDASCPPWVDDIPLQELKPPYTPPDKFLTLAAELPTIHAVWQMQPGVVPDHLGYDQALIRMTVHHNWYSTGALWSFDELAQLLAAFRSQHRLRQQPQEYYQKIIWEAIELADREPAVLGMR